MSVLCDHGRIAKGCFHVLKWCLLTRKHRKDDPNICNEFNLLACVVNSTDNQTIVIDEEDLWKDSSLAQVGVSFGRAVLTTQIARDQGSVDGVEIETIYDTYLLFYFRKLAINMRGKDG